MLPLLVFMAAAGPLLTLDDALVISGEDYRVADVAAQFAAARSRVPAALSWAAPQLKAQVSGSDRADPVLSSGYSLVPQDVTHRSTLGFDAGVSWVSPLGTDIAVGVGMLVADTDDVYNPLDVTYAPRGFVALRQHLLRGTGAALFAAHDAALALADGADAQRRSQRWALFGGIAEAYLNAMRAQEVLALRKRSVELGVESRRISDDLIRIGIQSPVDRAAAEQGVAQRELDLARAERDLNNARARLAQTRAVALDSEQATWERVQGLEDVAGWCIDDFVDVAGLQDDAIANDPELVTLDARARALRATIAGSANAELPDVQIGIEAGSSGLSGSANCAGGYTRDGVTPCLPRTRYVGGPADALAQAGVAQLYSVGATASVALPLWNEPVRAQTSALGAELAALAARAAERTRNVRLAVRVATADAMRSVHILEVATAADAAARAAVEAEVQKLKAGRSTVIDVLRTQDGLLAVAGQRIDALNDLAGSVVFVRLATMQLLGPPGTRFSCRHAEKR